MKINCIGSYPVCLTSTGRVTITLPRGAKQLESAVIYDFFNSTSGKHLRGQTTNFYTRMKGYQTEFNLNENRPKIAQDIHKGDVVRLKIIHIVKPNENIDTLETNFINEIPKNKRYNSRKGGGGGTKAAVKASETTPRTKKVILESIKSTYQTPEEKATLFKSPRSGRIRIQATKEFRKNTTREKGIYKFSYKGKTYPGETANMWKRFREHTFFTNHCYDTRYKKVTNQLYKDAHRSPEKVEIKAIKTKLVAARVLQFTGKEPSRSQLEAGYIQFFDSLNTGYSKTSGGNGSSSKNK